MFHANTRNSRALMPAVIAALCAALLLTACGGSGGGNDANTGGGDTGAGGPSAARLAGTVFGGRQPVIGAKVTAYAAGANPGEAAVELGTDLTAGDGSFNIPLMGDVMAGTLVEDQLVYLTATGGDAGGGVNEAIALMTVAGPYCDPASAGCAFPDFVNIDELATVASTSVLQDFLRFVDCSTIVGNSNTGTCVGVPGAADLVARAGTLGALVDISNGQASAFLRAAANNTPVNLTRKTLNTLGNILAGCVNSNGPGSAGCSSLFDIVLNAENTLQAAFQIATKPTFNRSGNELFALQAVPLIYTPALASAPDNWTVGGQRFVFAANGAEDTVSVYRRSPANGALVPIDLSVAAGDDPKSVTLTRDGAFAYVANAGSDNVSAYAVDPATGALTEVAGSPFAAGDGPRSITLGPDGGVAYVANDEGDSVSAYTIDPVTGALSPVTAGGACGTSPDPGNCFAAGDQPFSVTVGPGGGFAYVANFVSDDVSAYSIDPVTGALTPVTGSPFAAGDGPFSVAVGPGGGFAYVANFVGSNVSAYSIAATGALTPVTAGGAFNCGTTPDPGNCFDAGVQPVSVAVGPAGGFAYVVNRTSEDLSAYRIDAGTGALTAIAGSPFATGNQPRSIALAPGGAFAYVTNFLDGNLSGYAVDPVSGVLTEIGVASPFAVVDDGRSVAAAPGGRFIYVGNSDTGSVSGFAIDPATGVLTEVAGSPFMADDGTRGIAVGPAGEFVYAVNTSGVSANNISGYRVDPATGALDPLPGFPVNTLQNPQAVTFHPDGDTLYVANANADRVSAYAVNRLTGALTELAGSPVRAGDYPDAIAVTPDGNFAYVSNGIGNDVSAYSIGPGGALNSITTGGAGSCGPDVSVDPGNCYPTGNSPSGVAVDPGGDNVYVANTIGNNVSVFAINPVTGALSELSGSPFAAADGPTSAAVTPDGAFVYVGVQGPFFSPDPKVFAYNRNPATGALSAVMGSPFDSSSQSLSIAVDPTGRFVYVPGAFDAPGTAVTGFSINPATGELTEINLGSPFDAGFGPQSVAAGP